MHQKYVAVLTAAERAQLEQLIAASTAPARKYRVLEPPSVVIVVPENWTGP
jgi:hypothetical protein